MTLASSRRGFLAAFAAFTGSATAAGATVAVAARAAQPDAELFSAVERWERAAGLLAEGQRRYSEAARAAADFLGPCPSAILIDWQRGWLHNYGRGDEHRLGWANWYAEGDEGKRNRWTGPTLRDTIAALPAELGKAGRTPKIIRYLRSLLPLAEARDTKDEMAERLFGVDALVDALSVLERAWREAGEAIVAAPATTPAGVALKARYALAEHERLSGGRYLSAGVKAALNAAIAMGAPA